MNRTARGFTLAELLVVVVITGILASVLVVFLRPAIDSYLATQRRANLTDMADTALRRMRQDIRSAVPNSLRTLGATCFQLVPTSGGGRYRMAGDINFGTATGSAPLDPSRPPPTTTSMPFDVFNMLRSPPVLDDWVVINNQNTNDVYNAVNRARVLGTQTPAPAPGGAAVGRHRIFVTPHAFPSGYDGGRFVTVPNNGGAPTVVYNCTGGTLFRGNVAFSASLTATECAAANQIVATNAACTFVYNPNQGATQQSGFMQMQLTLTDQEDHEEFISLVHGVHVENIP